MTELPNPWTDLDSAPTHGSDTAVASCVLAQVPDAAVGCFVSDGATYGSLPSGESESSVRLAHAPSESIALIVLEQAWLAGNDARFDSVSDGAAGSPLPSGEVEPFVGLLAAPSESSSCDGSFTLPGPSVDSSNGRYDPLNREVEGATSESGPQETTSESARIPARGHLAAGVESFPTPAVFSLPESAVPPGLRVMAGDTGETHPLVSSPADDLQQIIALVDPPLAMPNRNRFDACFDPVAFMAELDPPPIFLNSKSGAK